MRHYVGLVKLVKLVFLGGLVGGRSAILVEIIKAYRARLNCPVSAWSRICHGASRLRSGTTGRRFPR